MTAALKRGALALALVTAGAVAATNDDGGETGTSNKGGAVTFQFYNAVAWHTPGEPITMPEIPIVGDKQAGAGPSQPSGAYSVLMAGGMLGEVKRFSMTEELVIQRVEMTNFILKHPLTTPDMRCNSMVKESLAKGEAMFNTTMTTGTDSRRLTAATALYNKIAAIDYIPGIPGGGKGALKAMLTAMPLGVVKDKAVFLFPTTYVDGSFERFPVRAEAMFGDLPLDPRPDGITVQGMREYVFSKGGSGVPQGCPFGAGTVTPP